jgi:predicted phosphohydrolase
MNKNGVLILRFKHSDFTVITKRFACNTVVNYDYPLFIRHNNKIYHRGRIRRMRLNNRAFVVVNYNELILMKWLAVFVDENNLMEIAKTHE